MKVQFRSDHNLLIISTIHPHHLRPARAHHASPSGLKHARLVPFATLDSFAHEPRPLVRSARVVPQPAFASVGVEPTHLLRVAIFRGLFKELITRSLPAEANRLRELLKVPPV